ncbi:hypothetical protein IWZ03DRAFT_424880, partial [Phyllosticta citriasiana]
MREESGGPRQQCGSVVFIPLFLTQCTNGLAVTVLRQKASHDGGGSHSHPLPPLHLLHPLQAENKANEKRRTLFL